MPEAAHLKLVPDNHVDLELDQIAGDMIAAKRALVKGGGNGANGHKPAEILPPPPGELRYNDLANSKRFLNVIGEDLLYCAESKKWMLWDRTHWQSDNTDFVFKFAGEFAAALYDDATDTPGLKNADRANNRSGFNAFLELAQRAKTVSIDAFDNQPRKLNCKNGTLDLQTGALDDHAREDLITRRVNCEYNADARSDTWDDFLATIIPDPAIRAFLQRSIGYSLLGTVRERSFWILYGTGNNGKSIFTNVFQKLLGDYAATTTTASIMAGKGSSIPNDIARLKGKRFVVVPETEENERMNAALVKALSAGDKVTARFLFSEFFDFEFTAKLWIATNHKPTITDHSKGFWDRVKLVPFSQNIAADKVIKSDDLMAKLLSDAPAILNWAVQGCRDYFDLDGLDVPEVIQNEIGAYRKEQDSIAQFIEERCETIEQGREKAVQYIIEADYRVSNGDFYAAYKKFCDANGEYLRSHRRLSQNMKERGFRQLASAGRYWEGIRLIDSD